jgi:hypothetical protein
MALVVELLPSKREAICSNSSAANHHHPSQKKKTITTRLHAIIFIFLFWSNLVIKQSLILPSALAEGGQGTVQKALQLCKSELFLLVAAHLHTPVLDRTGMLTCVFLPLLLSSPEKQSHLGVDCKLSGFSLELPKHLAVGCLHFYPCTLLCSLCLCHIPNTAMLS